MGFFDFLAGAAKSGMDAMQKQVDNATVEEALKFRGRSTYELKELINNVEKQLTKRAIVIAIALNGSTYEAIETAKENNISRRSLENLVGNNRIGNVVESILRDWPKN